MDTATDAAPAVKVGDKVTATEEALPVASRTKGYVNSIGRSGDIMVCWKHYGYRLYGPVDFPRCCEIRPSRRALREQLQKAEAELSIAQATLAETWLSRDEYQQELQQARGLIAGLLDIVRVHGTATGRSTPFVARADAFLAGTMDTVAPSTEVAPP